MARSPLMPAPFRSRRLGLLAAGAALSALALTPGLTGTANAANTAVASITVGPVQGDVAAPAGTAGSAPTVLTAIGRTVSIAVSFLDADGLPTSFGKATDIKLATSGGVGGGSTTTVGATAQSVVLQSAPFTAAGNKVTVTVSVPSSKGKNAISAVTSSPAFDVLTSLEQVPSTTTGFTKQVGKNGSACAEVTEATPFCATLLLPLGAGPGGTSPIVVGTGVCDSSYTNCPAASFVVELLADLSGYSATQPAVMILDCDKKFCGNGSIKRNVPSFAVGGNDTLVPVPACTAKGVAPDPGSATGPYACVDYVQSTRDNAGDTHLWVLFARDARGSCC